MANNIFTRFFNKPEQRSELSEQFNANNPVMGTLNFAALDTYTTSKSLKLSVNFRCINIISDSIAIMPLNIFTKKGNWNSKDETSLLDYLFNVQPNQFMSAFTFKKQLVQNVLMNGNGYILIRRGKDDQINELVLLDPNTVQVIAIQGEIKYNVISTTYYNLPLIDAKIYDKSEIIHIMNFSLNGFVGISTINYANLVLGTAYSAEVQANNYFTSNGILSGILKPAAGSGNLQKGQSDKLKSQFLSNLNTGLNTGSNSIIVLDSGLDYQTIQTNPKDSMLIESRQYSALQISQFYGVPQSKLNLYPKMGAAGSAEAENIEFLTNTLLPLMEKIENEIERKIILPVDSLKTTIEFDPSNLLRLDASTQADIDTKYFSLGATTTNEIRQNLGKNFPVTGGNRSYVAQNVQPLDMNLNDIKAGVKPTVAPADLGSTAQ